MKKIPIIVILFLISLFFIMLCRYNQKNVKNEIDNKIEESYETTPTISTKYDNKDIRRQNLKEQQLQELQNQLQNQLHQLQQLQKQEKQLKDNKQKLQLEDQKSKINKMIKELINKINILK